MKMQFYTIRLSMKALTIVGVHPGKGFSVSQICLFTTNIFLAAATMTIIINALFTDGNTDIKNAIRYMLIISHVSINLK